MKGENSSVYEGEKTLLSMKGQNSSVIEEERSMALSFLQKLVEQRKTLSDPRPSSVNCDNGNRAVSTQTPMVKTC